MANKKTRGPGRPASQEKLVRVHVTMPEGFYKQIKKLAGQEQRTVTGQIIFLLAKQVIIDEK